MAEKPKAKTKQDWGGAEAERFLVEAQARMAEAQRIKSYQEILNAGKQNLENPRLTQTGAVSAYDVASPYYGDQMQQQYEAAAQYAAQLAASESPKVTIPESYYKQFTRQVPITIGSSTPAYNVDRDVLQMPNPALYKAYMTSVGESPENISHNNYASNALSPEQISVNLMDYWRNTIEHEAAHIPDKQVEFAKKPPLTISTHTGSAAFEKPTYMAEEHHLVTGLGKVQREQYSMTGKRFESPEEFKDFIFNLAKLDNPEEAISGFSEEARRTLRPQIQNAIHVKKYEDLLDAWKNKKGWFKGQQPLIQGNPDLLEKSSQLIPALVSNYTSENYTS